MNRVIEIKSSKRSNPKQFKLNDKALFFMEK
jgi:hypothetical protein